MEVNQISQLFKIMGTGASQSTTGVSGNDLSGAASSSFEDLLNQIVSNSQDQTLNNASTSVASIDSSNNTVSGLDSLSLQSQKAQQLAQMVMEQMMQMISTKDTSSSSSIGSVENNDSSDSLFPSTNSNNNLTQLLQTLVQEKADTSATASGLNNSSQVNNEIK